MRTKCWIAVKAAGALVALGALLVGVPVALAHLAGWPLPRTWPHGDLLTMVVRDGVADSVWIKVLALVVWVAWAELAVSIVADVVGRRRGRYAHRQRGIGWAQDLAGRLVGTVVLVAGLFGSTPHATASAPAPAAAPSLTTALAAVAAPAPVVAVPAAPLTHVVARGESLSSIARDELGDATAWPVLWEANHGRAFGHRVFDDPNLILPGWELDLAPPATLIPPLVLSAADDRAPASPMPVRAPASPVPVRAPSDAPAPAAGVGLREPATTTSTPTTTVAPATGAAVQPVADHGQAPAWTRLGAVLGATLLATGLAGMITSSRRRALRASTTADAVVVPEPEVADVVTAVEASSDAVSMARLELALRALAGQLARAGSEAQPVAVRRRDEVIEVVLDRPAALASPWVPGADDRTWELPAEVDLTDLTADARHVAAPCPALVGVGHDADGHEVYVDLEAVGSVRVAPGSMQLLATTLAVTPLADGLQLVVVGQLPLPEGRHDVRHVADITEAIGAATTLTAAAAASGAPSTFRLRAVASHETWEPVVVVLTEPAPADPVAELRRLAGSRRGVVVVGVDLDDAALDLTGGDDGRIRVAGWSVRPGALDRPVAEAVAAAVDRPLVVAGAPGVDPEADAAAAESYIRRPWTLMVRVLGPVDVVDAEGRAAEFQRAKALELITWLAQHPQSATRAGARAALWAIDVSNASFSNVVSEARRAMARLASPPDGDDWVARTYAERLPLHPDVALDADLVRRHLDRARRLPDPEAITELWSALELVRGAPYAGRAYLWPDAEALPSTLTLLVTTVAAELGRRLLDAGDLDGVFAATAVGLDVLPGHEELIALRLRAHAQRGDRSALHREYMSYEHAVLADPWDGEPSPTLVALRRELLQPIAGA